MKSFTFLPIVGSIIYWLILVSITPLSGFAQNLQMLWSRSYGLPGILNDEVCLSVASTQDGGFALAGYTNSQGAGSYDFWLVRVDSAGDSLWSRTFGGLLTDLCYAVKQTPDGGFVLAGTSNSFGPSYDFWLVKTDASGTIQWSRTYGSTLDDQCWALDLDTDGGYILAGTWNGTWFGSDVGVVKTDSLGNPQWVQVYGGSDVQACRSIQQVTDGGYVLAGYRWTNVLQVNEVLLIKTDASGTLQWSRTYGWNNVNADCHAVRQTPDGGYALAGEFDYITPFTGYGLLMKTNAGGDILWTRQIGQGGIFSGDAFYAVDCLPDNGFILGGFSEGDIQGSGDFWLVRTNSVGDTLWTQTFSNDDPLQGLYGDICTAVEQTEDGGFVMAGYTGQGDFVSQLDFWLVRTTPDPTSVPFAESIPGAFSLSQNYPNPFNSSTEIRFQMTEVGVSQSAEIVVYNVKGQKVKQLVSDQLSAGQHSVIWNGDDDFGKPVSSGIYYYKLSVNGKIEAVNKCLLLK